MDYKEEIRKLQQQLKEKDEEIEKLKSDYELLQKTYIGTCATYKDDHKELITQLKSNTKQVCEKIREYFDLNNLVNYTPADAFTKYKPAEITIYVKCLREFLDQIEKGE